MKLSIETHKRRGGGEVLWVSDEPDVDGQYAFSYRMSSGHINMHFVYHNGRFRDDGVEHKNDLIPKPQPVKWEVWLNEQDDHTVTGVYYTADAAHLWSAPHSVTALIRVWCEADGTLGIERVENSRDE